MRGKPLVWDVTCVSTLAQSHVQDSLQQPGAAAKKAEEEKSRKYQDLTNNYCFNPLGFETTGHWGAISNWICQGPGQTLVPG